MKWIRDKSAILNVKVDILRKRRPSAIEAEDVRAVEAEIGPASRVSGDSTIVKDALYQLATRLHGNPSRSQHLMLSSSSNHRAGGGYMGPNHGAPMGPHSVMGPYGGYKNDRGDWAASAKEFSLRFVCPTENIVAVIGKGGVIIKQIRQESGACIKVDSDTAEEDDCLITVSAKEVFEEPSPTIDAAMRLQPRCSERSEKHNGVVVLTTHLLVPSSRIGCLIGKGGAIISEMRSPTRANIRIITIENLPTVASEDEEMVQVPPVGIFQIASYRGKCFTPFLGQVVGF